jgi:hypothetical protein
LTAILKKPGAVRGNPPLHVIVPVFNPVRYHSRYSLHEEFVDRVRDDYDVELHVVELAFGDREWHVTAPDDPNHVQLRTDDELWHKEGMINVAMGRLPKDWEYVAWIDGDVQFLNPRWASETIHQLQHHHIVQLFQNAVDLGPSGEVMQMHAGFAHQYVSGAPQVLNGSDVLSYYSYDAGEQVKAPFWHPGFAWAATREAVDAMGGLIDWAILGSADHHMALAWIGQAAKSAPPGLGSSYLDDLLTYQDRCERHIRRDIGYVPGTIMHHWHGKKRDRRYVDRWKILTENHFDPRRDIRRDHQGLYLLDPDRIGLRDQVRSYMRARNEDSIDND